MSRPDRRTGSTTPRGRRRSSARHHTALTSDIPPGEARPYKCKNGMWDAATPVTVDGRRLGTVFTGQCGGVRDAVLRVARHENGTDALRLALAAALLFDSFADLAKRNEHIATDVLRIAFIGLLVVSLVASIVGLHRSDPTRTCRRGSSE